MLVIVAHQSVDMTSVGKGPKKPKEFLVEGKTLPKKVAPHTRQAAERLDLHG